MLVKNEITLSVLIPCYNWDIYQLVNTTHNLCLNCDNIHRFEIICIEDGSDNCFKNHSISQLQNVTYLKRKENIGRSRIRNMMAKTAKYQWLLFMDCDSEIKNANFIKNYILAILNNSDIDKKLKNVYYGATIYTEKPPEKNYMLHWKYGKKIESKRKNNNFSSHHFLIHKTIFTMKNIQFNETIRSYGYEDVFFILKNNLQPIYINTSLYHIGIKKNRHFLKDTESAINNLMQYSAEIQNMYNYITLIRFAILLDKIYLNTIIYWLFKKFKNIILDNLNSENPSLFLFQFYKLGLFLEKKDKSFTS